MQTLTKGQKVVLFVAGIAPCGGVDVIKSCTSKFIRTVNGISRPNGEADVFVPVKEAGVMFLTHTHKVDLKNTMRILNADVEKAAEILRISFRKNNDYRADLPDLCKMLVQQAQTFYRTA